MIEIMLLSGSGIVLMSYKEDIQEGRSVNDIFLTFLEKGDDGMPVSLRAGDSVSIHKTSKPVV